MYSNLFIAAASAAASTASTSGSAATIDTRSQMISMAVSIGLLLVVGYFFILRPQKKKEKETKQLRDNLQIGDEITTIGGIIGIVVRKNDDSVVIETGGDRSKLRVKLWAISENSTVHDTVEEAPKPKKTKPAKDNKNDENSIDK